MYFSSKLKMRSLSYLLILFFITPSIVGQVKIATWNLNNLGSSKTDDELIYIANKLKEIDLIAIQEIVINPNGAKALSKIHDELNRASGFSWEYSLSSPTKSSPYHSERYAFIWKKSSVKLTKKPFLEPIFKDSIEREPYVATFTHKNKNFTLVNFHALPKKKQPEREIKYFKLFPSHYPKDNIIFLGDFNIPEHHSVFNPLKKAGYKPAFSNQKTTLRQKCINNDCLASNYDNFYYNSKKIELRKTEPIYFFEDFKEIKEARKISDHIPLMIEILIL